MIISLLFEHKQFWVYFANFEHKKNHNNLIT